MKIKFINNNIKNISEADVTKAPLESPTSHSEQPKMASDMMEARGFSLYMAEQQRESMPVHIQMSDIFEDSVYIPKAPADINNLMKSFITNKARKTKNIGGVMVDPVETYDQAENLCQKYFGKFFKSGIKLTKDTDQIKQNKRTVRESEEFDNDLYELFEIDKTQYNAYFPLNEAGLGVAGYTIGMGLGELGAAGLSFLGGVGAGIATTIGPSIMAIALSSTAVGMAGQALFGDVAGHGTSNDEVAAHISSPDKLMIQSAQPKPFQKGNIVKLLDDYISKILGSAKDILSALSPNASKKFNEVITFSAGIKNANIKNIDEFINKNSKYLEEQRKLIEQFEKNKLKDSERNAKDSEYFVTNLYKLAKNFDEHTKAKTIVAYYQKNISNFTIKSDLDDALKTSKNVIDIWNIYSKLKSENPQASAENASASFQYNYPSLNEEELSQKSTKQIIDVDDKYGQIKTELEQRMNQVIDELDPKAIVGLEETKQEMQKLITAADNEIKHKIEIITKSPTGQNYGRESGLGTEVIKFLAAHPLEAETLQGIWSRHLGDLQTRMNTRIKQMTDFNNPNRTLGWIKTVLRDSFPDILARLLALRYAYDFLSREGMYNYNTEKTKQDIKLWKKFKKEYMASNRSKMILLIDEFCKEYTKTGESCLIASDQGLTYNKQNPLVYGSFLLSRISPLYTNPELLGIYSNALSNLKNAEGDDEQILNALLNLIYNNMRDDWAGLLNSEGDDEKIKEDFDKLGKQIQMPQDIIDVKKLILETYNNIHALSNEIKDENIATKFVQSLEIIVNNPNIYDAYMGALNKDKNMIDNALELLNNKGDSSTGENKNLSEAKKQIRSYFKDINFKITSAKETIAVNTVKKLFGDVSDDAEYYTYILSWFGYDNINKIQYNGENIKHSRSKDGITKICKMVPVLLKLAVTGILADIALEDEETNKNEENAENNKEKEIVNIFKDIKPYCEEIKNAIINKSEIDASNNSNPVTNTIKEEYDKHYEAVINYISEKYKNLTNKELNISEINDIVNKIVSYSNKDQYKVVVDILKDIIFEKDSNKKFGELNLDEQYNILYNLNISINSIKDLVEWQELTKAIKELEKYGENANAYPQLNSNPNNESIIYFNDKQYNIVNNIYVLNEDNNEDINNTESSDIEKGINIISKDENKAKEILAILKGEKDSTQSTEQINNNEEIIKSLDNMTEIITAFSL